MIFMLPVGINAQEQDREQVLLVDIDSLVTRAVRDRIITKEESRELIGFVRDSLPEGTDLKIRALEQIRNELDAANAAEEHGDGEGGCSTEKAARGETGNTTEERIADFRARIAERKQATGKEYLSFYFVEATAYEVLE